MIQQQLTSIFSGIFLLFSAAGFAQQKVLHYNVLNKNDVVGQMVLTQNKTGETLGLRLTSDVQTKGFMSVNVKVEEESRFERGKLVSSSVKRYMNGKEKTAKTTTASAAGYVAADDSGTRVITKEPILYNIGMLYLKEPQNIKQLYSDNFQAFIPVEEIEQHVYKIMLPDKNYNIYYYAGGICTKVEVHNGLYNMQMVLQE